MTEIIIIRHGETEWNKTGRFQGHSDIALSQEGRAQAAALGRNLAVDDVDAIYASDLTRAMETASGCCSAGVEFRRVGRAQLS